MVADQHICPFGLKARDLLEREGFTVEDHYLTSGSETEAFKGEHGVKTPPQVFIAGQRIGGYDALRKHLGKPVADPKAVTYQPVIAVFATAALMALAASWAEGFSNMFLGHDLLAQRVVRYAYAYPFGEALAGILMIAGALTWIAIPVALVIGGIGAASVFKAVYVDKRDLKCACMGGDSNVLLGFVSLTGNLMMVAMAVWMTFEMEVQ